MVYNFGFTFPDRAFMFVQAATRKSPETGCRWCTSLQSCMTQFQEISSWLLVFNNLSKDWCWGRWPFQWYIIHHQCGLCPLQWWEWCGSMNIYSSANVGLTRLVSRATHTRALMCDGWWHQCPAAGTSLTAQLTSDWARRPMHIQKQDNGSSTT